MSEISGELLEQISSWVLTAKPDGPPTFFLYAEAARAVSDASVYQEFDDRAVWVEPSHDLCELLIELWDIADDDKKWGTLMLSIDGDRFTAHFDYVIHLDVEDDLHDYREEALLKRYGNKPVIYPPEPATR